MYQEGVVKKLLAISVTIFIYSYLENNVYILVPITLEPEHRNKCSQCEAALCRKRNHLPEKRFAFSDAR